MKSIPAFAILAVLMYVCGLDNGAKQNEPTPPPVAPSPKKQDKDALLAELVRLENDITRAALNGDITLLAKNTTDDFVLTGVDGKVQNKNEALADIKKEKNIKNFSITDAELLSFSEESAVLQYTQNVTLKSGQSGSAKVIDTWVKKDGRWLVKGEQQTMIKK